MAPSTATPRSNAAPVRSRPRPRLNTVAVLLLEQVAVFEFGVVSEVFGIDRTDDGVPPFDFRVCSPTPGVPMDTSSGSQVIAPHGLDGLVGADLVAVPAGTIRDIYPADAVAALRRAADDGATLLSVCSGAFLLGAAGLLDGRPCATHWRYAAELARRHPTAGSIPTCCSSMTAT
jgi:transcriptional regulator GlxA family with amidase domain